MQQGHDFALASTINTVNHSIRKSTVHAWIEHGQLATRFVSTGRSWYQVSCSSRCKSKKKTQQVWYIDKGVSETRLMKYVHIFFVFNTWCAFKAIDFLRTSPRLFFKPSAMFNSGPFMRSSDDGRWGCLAARAPAWWEMTRWLTFHLLVCTLCTVMLRFTKLSAEHDETTQEQHSERRAWLFLPRRWRRGIKIYSVRGGNGVRATPALFDHRSTSRKNLKVAKNKTQRL